MHRQVLPRDGARDGHGIEDFHEHVVDFAVEALHHFVAEGERLRHVPRLVIPAEQHHVVGEIKLDGEEKNAHFDSKDAAIDIVAEEEKLRVRLIEFAIILKYLVKIIELTMHITNYGNFSFDSEQVRFIAENIRDSVKDGESELF